MKTLIIVLAVAATSLAFAETETDIRVNRIEMTEVAPDESGETKATDHNSSRSNKTSSVAAPHGGADDSDADNSDAGGTEATDYNSSRSNKADGAVSDEDSDEDAPADKPRS